MNAAEIRYGFIAEYGGARYRVILLDPVEELLLRPFKGAEIGRWYRIVMSGTGTQAGEIPVRIAVIFETRLAGTGSVKTGPYQVLIPVMKADLPMHPSSNRQAKNMFYSPVLQTEGTLLRLDDERQFRHGKLYAAYVTVSSFNNPVEGENLEDNSLSWILEGCDIIGEWDLLAHASCSLPALLPQIQTAIEEERSKIVGVYQMEDWNFQSVSTFQSNKVDKAEELSPICGQTFFKKISRRRKQCEPSPESVANDLNACTTRVNHLCKSMSSNNAMVSDSDVGNRNSTNNSLQMQHRVAQINAIDDMVVPTTSASVAFDATELMEPPKKQGLQSRLKSKLVGLFGSNQASTSAVDVDFDGIETGQDCTSLLQEMTSLTCKEPISLVSSTQTHQQKETTSNASSIPNASYERQLRLEEDSERLSSLLYRNVCEAGDSVLSSMHRRYLQTPSYYFPWIRGPYGQTLSDLRKCSNFFVDVEFDESKNLITISGINEDDVNYMRNMISDIRRDLDLQVQAMTKVTCKMPEGKRQTMFDKSAVENIFADFGVSVELHMLEENWVILRGLRGAVDKQISLIVSQCPNARVSRHHRMQRASGLISEAEYAPEATSTEHRQTRVQIIQDILGSTRTVTRQKQMRDPFNAFNTNTANKVLCETRMDRVYAEVFAFCWRKNDAEASIVLYEGARFEYKQAPANMNNQWKLGIWFKIRYSKDRSTESTRIKIHQHRRASPDSLTQLPPLRMSPSGEHTEICIDNWSRIGPDSYRSELGDLRIMDKSVNEIMKTAIDNQECHSIWCRIEKEHKLEFVPHPLPDGNSGLLASANDKENQLNRGQCSNSNTFSVPKKPLRNNQMTVTTSNVDKTMPQVLCATNNNRVYGKAFAFCWHKNKVDASIVLYTKRKFEYKQVAVNMKLGHWYKIHYSEERSSKSAQIQTHKLAAAVPERIAQLPKLKMSPIGGHVEIRIDNWFRTGSDSYRSELGDLRIMDQSVNTILTTSIVKGKTYPIWCRIKEGWQLEFVDYEYEPTDGNCNSPTSVNDKENQLNHGQCSNHFSVPQEPINQFSVPRNLSNNQTTVTTNNVDKTIPQIGTQSIIEKVNNYRERSQLSRTQSIIEKDVMVLWRKNKKDAFFVVFDSQKGCFTRFCAATKPIGAMTKAFAGLRIGGWYNVTYQNYAKTGQQIWVRQIEETRNLLPTRVSDSVEFCVTCQWSRVGDIFRSANLGEFSPELGSGQFSGGRAYLQQTQWFAWDHYAWFRLGPKCKFSFVEPLKAGMGYY